MRQVPEREPVFVGKDMLDIKNGELKISVRNLVEFLCRSGNIDNRFGGITDAAAMAAGVRAHKKIQKSRGADYKSEVPLKYTQDCENFNIVIEGRADGIEIRQEGVCIEEIKGTYRETDYITQAEDVHKAQAMCYAFMYADRNDNEKITIRITYVNLDNGQVKSFWEEHSHEDLKEWFGTLIKELKKWGNMIYAHNLKKYKSIKELKFPFEYRPKQRELAVNVYKAIENSEKLFIQAPTGIGKTLSTVFPAIKAAGENKVEKIFYLTAKTITGTAAGEAFAQLRKNGLEFKTITLTAKEKICFMEGELKTECNPLTCPYAKGHFDRVNAALFDITVNEKTINRSIIEDYARRHKVCPFEFALDVSYFVDGIICDYNYVFDPDVYLKRFFAGDKNEYVFLVDEAHNLVDRARGMYSASVYKEHILNTKKLLGTTGRKLVSALEKCNHAMLLMKRECQGDYRVVENIDLFALNMRQLESELQKYMENHRTFAFMNELLNFYFEVRHFNEMYDMAGDDYIFYTEHEKEGFKLCLFCVNPSENLLRRIDRGRTTIFFSATLIPVNYYKELLTGDKNEKAIYAMSPFDTKKRLLVVGSDVSSRYTRRNYREFEKIKEYISIITCAKKGNYMVFFPSYGYMESVYGLFTDTQGIIKQSSDMSEDEKEKFLERFNCSNGEHVTGFCVMGGMFSEGIDLKYDRLIGVIIIGPGLPSINTEGEILRRYYDEKEDCGYEYAYVYPGMNKVLQAAGRVIRTDRDRGVIALLDDRFLTNQYVSLFPVEWSDYKTVSGQDVKEEILDFWHE